jgi:DeoR/GlpR family transcriptional regulator of sugar metabolism
MLVADRRNQVLDLVKQRGFMTLAELAQQIGVSESTARRDLEHWQARGLLRRIHGGAMSVEDSSTAPGLETRAETQVLEKQRIAAAAAQHIRNGEAIMLDGGTTTLELARLLVGRPLQVVSNSLPIANLFTSSRETDLVILGGYVYPAMGLALGPLTLQMMKDIQVQQAFLSVAGLTARGLFNSNPLLVETERQMMRCAEEVVVLADHSKIGRQALAFLCELSAIDTLIVDSDLSPEQHELLRQAEARVILARKTSVGRSPRRSTS